MNFDGNNRASFRAVRNPYLYRSNSRRNGLIILAITVLIVLSGCSFWNSLNKTEKGAVIGTGSGAVIGGASGSGAGAVVGGVAGGVAGGLIGNELEKRDRKN